jgi:hypothetical protein
VEEEKKSHPSTPSTASDESKTINISHGLQTTVGEDGWATIIGFGSLLSERSARLTLPRLRNFRLGEIRGWRRVFQHTAPVFIERGIANLATREQASLSVEPVPGDAGKNARLVVTMFEVPAEDLPAFFERELEFRWLAASVRPVDTQGRPLLSATDGRPRDGILCAAFASDEEFMRERLGNSKAFFHDMFGRFGIKRLWRPDLLPCGVYLRHCVLAAQARGSACYESFLDHTFLGDRQTTVRAYLQRNPHVMALQPPAEFATRYNG